ncbi:Dnaj-like protein subfamily c member 28 [Plakobranchus ocellatus]|uniref:Dnaj-like protein subfamily c member 28 n=1 Tax=Plakobranchus ocellatus TaxID=259542 RepID=A0AAV4CY53_9GAST|nr:Dnaj-like protein subfamily c member 28 [Plakobranchus ocellatus]
MKASLDVCYSLLGIDPECSEEELRLAYLEKVKEYHPDKNRSVRDANKFVSIQEAYKTALEHKRGQAFIEEEKRKEEQDFHNIKHTVPQHRRYLTYDGVGFGTPINRARQYKQVRVAQATEAVYEHRKLKYGHDEMSLVNADKAQARKIKISNLIDRVVDDLIRESMQRGDFDNLSGRGRPLDYSDHNPFIDFTTHNINKIMVNNGFKPEWIMLSKEIRDNIAMAREKLAVMREKLGPPPYPEEDQLRWEFHRNEFSKRVHEINEMINKYNFIVPFMEKQMVHYNIERNVDIILERHKDFLPKDKDGKPMKVDQLGPLPQVHADNVKIHWGEVWTNIKNVFTSR